ncbi:ferritin-like domain-containing protein [Aneurinibacillus terranovensis]|uniref:ferritin-like domain-containing protein n=1 Tax=Aneurinibacillus terranovensis TaxID=278991 RepID=UPI00042558D2|nr:ferritin-like domain-containing protein [Aneurinibacillus terranovensis]
MYPYYYHYEPDSGLLSDTVKAINGEYSAIHCYKQLAKMAHNDEEKNRILEIRQDEIRHYQVFSKIYMSLTGFHPNPQITEQCPNDYKSGLQFALKDEQQTVDFYLTIADKTQDTNIKDRFRRAAADEQNHAVWFLYYYTKLCCDKS